MPAFDAATQAWLEAHSRKRPRVRVYRPNPSARNPLSRAAGLEYLESRSSPSGKTLKAIAGNYGLTVGALKAAVQRIRRAQARQ